MMDEVVVERIRQFAMQKAGLSEAEFQTVLPHDCATCKCDLCRKFTIYLSVKETLKQYEARIPDV